MNRKIFTDGHLNGLNGVGGVFPQSGYSEVQIENGTEKERIRRIRIEYSKKNLTNNEAETLALFHASMKALPQDTIFSDSQIAINLATKGDAKEPRLQLIAVVLKYLIEKKQLKLQWVKRENNPVT